jgi:hypothetical protein
MLQQRGSGLEGDEQITERSDSCSFGRIVGIHESHDWCVLMDSARNAVAVEFEVQDCVG